MAEKTTSSGKLTRRQLLSGVAIAGMGAFLAACAGGSPAAAPTTAPSSGNTGNTGASTTPTTASTSQPPASGSVVTVDQWDSYTGVDQTAHEKIINDYNAKNTGVKINRVYKADPPGSQANELLLTAIASGSPPGVARFDRFIVPQFAAQGFLTEVTDKAKTQGVKQEDYFPFAWEEATYKNKLWCLPHNTDTRGLWINMDQAKEAGLDTSKPPQKLDEMLTWADKLTKKDAQGRITQYGFNPIFSQTAIYTYGWIWKGEFYDKAKNVITTSDPKIVDSMKWFKQVCDKVGADNLDAYEAACANAQCNGANNYFYTGQVSMMWSGDWEVANTKKYKPDVKYLAVPLPGLDGPAPYGSWAGGWSFVIPKGAKDVDAAWKALYAIAGPDGELEYCKATYHIPTHVQSAKDPYFSEDPNHKVFMDLLPVSHTRPPVPVGSLLWDELIKARSDIEHGKKTPEQALKDVDDKVNAELKKFS